MTAPFEFETIPFAGETDFESETEGESEIRRGVTRPVVRDHRGFVGGHAVSRIVRRGLPRSRVVRRSRFIPRAQRLARRRLYGWQQDPGYWRARGPRWGMRRRYGGIYPTWLPDGTTPSDEPFEPDNAPPAPSFEPSFSPPSGGDDEKVRWIQSRLNDLLGITLPITGFIDPQTRSAVRSFQRQNGLPVDGIVGPPTEQALAQQPQAAAPDAGAPPPAGPAPSEPVATPPTAPNTEMEFGFGRRRRFRRRRRQPCNCNYDDQFEGEGE